MDKGKEVGEVGWTMQTKCTILAGEFKKVRALRTPCAAPPAI